MNKTIEKESGEKCDGRNYIKQINTAYAHMNDIETFPEIQRK